MQRGDYNKVTNKHTFSCVLGTITKVLLGLEPSVGKGGLVRESSYAAMTFCFLSWYQVGQKELSALFLPSSVIGLDHEENVIRFLVYNCCMLSELLD